MKTKEWTSKYQDGKISNDCMTMQMAVKALELLIEEHQKILDVMKSMTDKWKTDLGRGMSKIMIQFLESDVFNLNLMLSLLPTKSVKCHSARKKNQKPEKMNTRLII